MKNLIETSYPSLKEIINEFEDVMNEMYESYRAQKSETEKQEKNLIQDVVNNFDF